MNDRFSTAVHPLHDVPALERAQSLWYAAEYSACLDALQDALPSGERFLLAAWALYRLRRYDDALDAVAASDAFLFSSELKAEADALSAVLHRLKGNERESAIFAERAAGRNSAVFPKASNMLALRAWLCDDLAECLRRLRVGELSQDANIRAQALNIRAWSYASRRQFEQQAALLEHSLNAALSSPTPDMGLAAETLQSLSALSRELYLPDAFAALEEALAAFPWSSDLRTQQYNTLRQVAWTQALQGMYVTGLRSLKKAGAAAPSDELAALSTLDAAWIALVSGENNAARAHLDDALELLEDVDWDRQRGEEMRALLLAAEICCVFDVPRARRLLARYDEIKWNLSVGFGAKHAGTLDPKESFTRALVLSVSADVSRARKLAKQAYRQFAQTGYAWRAARCALFLYESGCGEKWLTAAREQARYYPRSFIGAQLERIRSESACEPLAKLTPRQRDVVRLLAEGDTVDGVAATLHTSPSTVRVHLKHIHRALGVRNRMELLRAIKQSA